MPVIKAPQEMKMKNKPKVCPSCSGLECFERPRYFCGQLLTDKDLDAGQRYVIEKSKLHNRYLVGTGVVCGLAVRCHSSCDGVVVIEEGYAIDCCGNDIVVCGSVEFDVLGYLKANRRQEEPSCNGKITPRPSRCDEEPKEYCLLISYNEEPSRPTTALVRNNGCNVNRCEPSRTNEVFRFDLIEKQDMTKSMPPSLWDKVHECVSKVWSQGTRFSQELQVAQKQDIQDIRKFHTDVFGIFCRMEAYITQIYRDGPNVRCNLAAKLHEIEQSFPAFTENPDARGDYLRQVYTAVFHLDVLLFQFIIDCICDALLVPCADCGDQEGVFLACLTVQCDKIEKICNTVRTQIISGPALRYWLQPLYAKVGMLLEFLCCEFDAEGVFGRLFRPQQEGFKSTHAAYTRAQTASILGRDFSSAAWNAVRAANFQQFLSGDTLTALDVYNLPTRDALILLKDMQISAVEKRAETDAEAYSLSLLARMTWVVPPGSRVELMISPNDRVTSIRVLRESTNEPQ